jgi:predicted MFS family arabinose efflux permease
VTRAELAEVLRAPNARLGLAVTLGLVVGQYAAYTFITPFLAGADHAGPGVVSALLLVFGIGGLVGNFGVVRLLSRRLKATSWGTEERSGPARCSRCSPYSD